MTKLIHVTADDPGFRRKGFGKGFAFFDDEGKKVHSKEDLTRIRLLRIPPAWKNVWVSANPDGHLQATGIDARGRKQYLYHEEWSRRSHINKFDRMANFAKVLPDLRKKIQLDLRKPGWPREKVVSLVISILDQSGIRIGNKMYEQENGTYGLTTLKRKHLKVHNGTVTFEFKGKSNLFHKMPIHGKKLTRLILECSEIPGQEVFQYLDETGYRHPVFSQDVNSYLQEISGGDYTAKDFRTWGGTVWAIELFPEALAELELNPKRKMLTALVSRVAEKLGNTIAVCRSHYIHPVMLDMTNKKEHNFEELYSSAKSKYNGLGENLSRHELVALYLIEDQK
ncbi:MAG: DNA topoisomerase IB [Bacteroidota bacterium]|nr:DNA topoisomerase IB [Bacteroidota bacterium]